MDAGGDRTGGGGYPGDELDARHIEHVHQVAYELGRRLAMQQEKHAKVIAILSGQKKNRMLLGLGKEITRLRGELEQALRALDVRTGRLKAEVLARPVDHP